MWFKGALLGLRQFLAIENPLKRIKNAFYFTTKALFVLKIFKFFVLNLEETAWLERLGSFQILWRHRLVSKQL